MPEKRKSEPGTGTQVISRWETGIAEQSPWVQGMIKALGFVLMAPFLAKIIRVSYTEVFAEHEHISQTIWEMIESVFKDWFVVVLVALAGLTFVIPKIGIPMWRWGWQRVPERWRGK